MRPLANVFCMASGQWYAVPATADEKEAQRRSLWDPVIGTWNAPPPDVLRPESFKRLREEVPTIGGH